MRRVEPEHLLLGLLREDKALGRRFLRSHHKVELIRMRIEANTEVRESISTSVDLPLSTPSKHVLALGAEEADRLEHKQIDTGHLLLGLLREEQSFAARLLREQGLTSVAVREQVHPAKLPFMSSRSAVVAAVLRWLTECEVRGGTWLAGKQRDPAVTTDLALYEADPSIDSEDALKKLVECQERIDIIVAAMQRAIGNHEFEQARTYSAQEAQERDNMRLLREQFHLENATLPIPLLRIKVANNDGLSDLQDYCDTHLTQGVPCVWILDAYSWRAYTATSSEGFREVKDDYLRLANPPLELELSKIFS